MQTKSIWNNINQVWVEQNLARHGKDEEEKREKERLQCISEITVYYNYRDDGKLGQLDTESIFYNTIQEHLHKEWILAELDTWLCTYRDIILQSKKQTATEKKKRAKRRKNREIYALNAIRNKQTTNTNSPRRIYQTRQQRKWQETINALIDTIESDSDSITSSEVNSGGNNDSDTSSISQYGEEDDSLKSGGLHSLDDIT